VRGALADFMPVVYEYEDDPAACNCVPQRHRVTVALEDFGEAYRDIEDCIALEVDRGDGEEPVWVSAIIVGRRLGPLLIQQTPVYVAVQDAVLMNDEN
jgi:hypothetical protein